MTALVALELLGARFSVAGLHLLLLRSELVFAFTFQAAAHEAFALVALELFAARFGVAGLHALLLRGELLRACSAAENNAQRSKQRRDDVDRGHDMAPDVKSGRANLRRC